MLLAEKARACFSHWLGCCRLVSRPCQYLSGSPFLSKSVFIERHLGHLPNLTIADREWTAYNSIQETSQHNYALEK
uniref:Uncharacterized protein n=1 Tax=Arundo donax TaxID=35708 RepID=A0A0A9BDG5_ARUDO